MAGLKKIDGYKDFLVNICPDDSQGDVIEISDIFIQLPKQPAKTDILFHDKKREEQMWKRLPVPQDLVRVRSMDEWMEQPKEFRIKHNAYIEQEFHRRRNGVWFYNNGVPTYITGHHYMLLQWSQMDIGYASFLDFQRTIFLHLEACKQDPRCVGQIYTKCRRSGYTNICGSALADEGTQVSNKVLGIMSKTGKDAQENIFMKKLLPMFRSYPFFFKPIQDGTTNPRVELAFREPAKRITKTNKVSGQTEALDTVINWKNSVANAYDGEKLHYLYLDEAGKWENPLDINEVWRVHRTCLLVGKKIVGKAMVGSTVNPLDKGGANYKKLYYDSDPTKRNENGRTKSGLYKLFIPAYEALEGFFDVYGMPVVEDPAEPTLTMDGDIISIGAKTYLSNERKALMHDPYELNEVIRQFPWSEEEAFRDSTKSSHFNVGKIYEQLQHNRELYPSPVIKGNFVWKDGKPDTEVLWNPDANGRWTVTWLPPDDIRNKRKTEFGKVFPANDHLGTGGVDSYDLDNTMDGRGSKGACHIYNKFNMSYPSNMFVAEYANRPPLARIFYEDVLMAAVFYGYPLLIENNKYGIVRYFESRGYDGYIMDRPEHLRAPGSSSNVKTKGIPSNSQDVIQAHAQAIEAYVHEHVGLNAESGEYGRMYLDKTLEDWIGYRIDDRTKFDLTISSGLALLAAQRVKQERKSADMSSKVFLRRFKDITR
jgi:hypothetical protein